MGGLGKDLGFQSRKHCSWGNFVGKLCLLQLLQLLRLWGRVGRVRIYIQMDNFVLLRKENTMGTQYGSDVVVMW